MEDLKVTECMRRITPERRAYWKHMMSLRWYPVVGGVVSVVVGVLAIAGFGVGTAVFLWDGSLSRFWAAVVAMLLAPSPLTLVLGIHCAFFGFQLMRVTMERMSTDANGWVGMCLGLVGSLVGLVWVFVEMMVGNAGVVWG